MEMARSAGDLATVVRQAIRWALAIAAALLLADTWSFDLYPYLPQWAPAVAAGRALAALARDIGAEPASLAMTFALLDPSVTTVLFGATRPEQVSANLGALALADRLTPEERDRLAAIGVP